MSHVKPDHTAFDKFRIITSFKRSYFRVFYTLLLFQGSYVCVFMSSFSKFSNGKCDTEGKVTIIGGYSYYS